MTLSRSRQIGITCPLANTTTSYGLIRNTNQMKGFIILHRRTGRPGPVVVDLPKDVQEGELDYPENITIDLPGYKTTKKGHPLQVKKASELILKSKKPVILAGGGIIHSESSEELQHLSELIGAPVTTTLMGKGCFPEDHPLALGMLGMHGRVASNMIVDECDCLIAVGCRFSDRTTGDVTKFAPNAKVIHIDVDPAEIGKMLLWTYPLWGMRRSSSLIWCGLYPRLKTRENLTGWICEEFPCQLFAATFI
jgi:acetolactate synthase-1/2/3 large subunit